MSSNVSYFHNILGREEAEEKLVADGLDKPRRSVSRTTKQI